MKQVTISKDRLNTAIERICDGYCKKPEEADSQEELNRICNDCPLECLLIDEYWENEE